MSTFIEFVLPDVATVEGLREELMTWEGENLPLDPPRYSYAGLAFTLVPLPRHVRAALPVSLRSVARCLELDPSLVADWACGSLPEGSERALRAFALAISRAAENWAAVYDPSSGPISTSHVDSEEFFEHLARVVEHARGMEVLVVP